MISVHVCVGILAQTRVNTQNSILTFTHIEILYVSVCVSVCTYLCMHYEFMCVCACVCVYVQQISSEGNTQRSTGYDWFGVVWKGNGRKEKFLIRSYCSVTQTPDLAGNKNKIPSLFVPNSPKRCQQLMCSDGFNNLGFLRDRCNRVYCSNGDRYLQWIWLKICLKLKDYP